MGHKARRQRGGRYHGRGHSPHKAGSRGGCGRAGMGKHKRATALRQRLLATAVRRKTRYVQYRFLKGKWASIEKMPFVTIGRASIFVRPPIKILGRRQMQFDLAAAYPHKHLVWKKSKNA